MAERNILGQFEKIKPSAHDPAAAFLDMCAARRDFLASMRRFMAEFHDDTSIHIEVKGTINILNQMLELDFGPQK